MSDLRWALRSVQDAPRGPRVGAFFDLDGTLVRGFTAFAFLRDQLMRGQLPPQDLLSLVRAGWNHRVDPDAGLGVIEEGVRMLAGRDLVSLERQAAKVFRTAIGPSIRAEARELVRAHQEAGHTVVLASAATPFQAQPVARDLGIEHLLTTEVEVVDGALTGQLAGPPRWGAEKARAVVDFAAARDLDLSASFAYGNGAEDRDFLHAVGRPVAVCPDEGLVAIALEDGIPRLELRDPPRPGWRGLAGTLASMGAFNTGVVATLGASYLVGKRTAFRHGFAATADAALRAAGVRLRIHGREHLSAVETAIFIFNHQSNLDPMVVASLVDRPLTGVGKKELENDPRAWALRFFDLALIDRGDSESARASVAALVDRIHAGESVLMAPEGTRMPTPNLGPFKRGAFHLALDAKVPVVPIVVRNTGELFPPGALLISPGEVDVCVLPPVSTDDWTRETVGDHADAIRSLYAETLERWPGG